MTYPIDPQQIVAFVRALGQPGEVREVRILGASESGWRHPHEMSGYYTHETADQIPAAIAQLAGYQGCYVTANPANPALLARAANRLAPAKRGLATGNGDIVARRWLICDLDTERPAGICATDAERGLAESAAETIAEILVQQGFPAPIVCDSGNGRHLLYQVDLPPDDGDLLKRVLASLGTAMPRGVHLDPTMASAARIIRLPGTWNCKGDHLPDRPHRLARLLELPETLLPAPREALDIVAAYAEPAPAPKTPDRPDVGVSGDPPGDRPGDHYNERGDLAALLTAHGWQQVGESAGNQLWRRPGKTTGNHSATFDGHTFYVFSSAAPPFEGNQGYSPFAAYALLEHGGDHTAAARALAEQGFGQSRQPVTDVDLSALLDSILGEPEPDEFDNEDRHPLDPGPFPRELYTVPGFLAEYQSWVLTASVYPCPQAVFLGGIAFLSWLTGRKIRSLTGLRTNLYTIIIGEAGVGKDAPRRANSLLLGQLGASACLAANMSSAEAIEDALVAEPATLWQCDEFDSLLHSMGQAGGDVARWKAISAMLRSIYSESASVYPCRRKAAGKSGEQAIRTVDNPHLVLLATATPDAFFAALSEQQAIDGLLSRCLLLDAPAEDRRSQPGGDLDQIPPGLLDRCQTWRNWQPSGDLSDIYPAPPVIATSEAALRILDDYRDQCDAEYREATGSLAPAIRAQLARSPAMAVKLALIHACSNSIPPEQPPILDAASATWAIRLADWLRRRMVWHLSRHLGDGAFQKAQQRLLRFLADRGGIATAAQCARHMRAVPHRTYEEVIKSLVQQERITEGVGVVNKFNKRYIRLGGPDHA